MYHFMSVYRNSPYYSNSLLGSITVLGTPPWIFLDGILKYFAVHLELDYTFTPFWHKSRRKLVVSFWSKIASGKKDSEADIVPYMKFTIYSNNLLPCPLQHHPVWTVLYRPFFDSYIRLEITKIFNAIIDHALFWTWLHVLLHNWKTTKTTTDTSVAHHKHLSDLNYG